MEVPGPRVAESVPAAQLMPESVHKQVVVGDEGEYGRNVMTVDLIDEPKDRANHVRLGHPSLATDGELRAAPPCVAGGMQYRDKPVAGGILGSRTGACALGRK